MSNECRPLVMCGPSGVGKTTLKEMLMKKYPGQFGFSVSHTTRPPRTGEADGVDYNFSTKEIMLKMIAEDKFVEYANVHLNIYGTSIAAVRKVMEAGKICILDIDIQGVNTIMNGNAHKELKPFYMFVQPKTFDALERRLRSRATDTEEQIQTRLNTAKSEIEASKSVPFDYFLTNHSLEKAFQDYDAYMLKCYPSLSESRSSKTESTNRRVWVRGALAFACAVVAGSCVWKKL